MTGGDLPATVLFGAVAAAVDSGLAKVLALAVVSTLLVVGILCWPWSDDTCPADDFHDDQLPQPCPCGTCGVAFDPADEDDSDDLMDLPDTLFDNEARPVNEPRDDRWGVLDGRNRGAWLDYVSRTSNTQNARWITGRQQEAAGRSLADEAADFLAVEAAREKRRREAARETTGEIRRGNPGE